MSKSVVLVGALDTKAGEFAYVRDLIAASGIPTIVVDFGVLGVPGFEPDVDRSVVARAAGVDLTRFGSGEHKDEAMAAMALGLSRVVRSLHDDGRLGGILGMGGTGGTAIATAAMRTLPVGIPKVMVSTVGGGDVSPYAGTADITFMPSVVDIAGLNRISRRILANAASAIAAMTDVDPPSDKDDKPLVVASMFGNTTGCVDHARRLVEAAGFEVLVFHATGVGGRTMEALIADGFAVASMDITTTELADDVCGGVFSAGPDRGRAAGRAGIPAVLVPGCVDMANFGAPDTLPDLYRNRLTYEWNSNVTLLRTNVDENRRIGERLAAAANEASGPVTVLLPLRGVSMLGAPGGVFWNPEADRACFDAIGRNVRPGIAVREIDANINDPAFAELVADTLLASLGVPGRVGSAII